MRIDRRRGRPLLLACCAVLGSLTWVVQRAGITAVRPDPGGNRLDVRARPVRTAGHRDRLEEPERGGRAVTRLLHRRALPTTLAAVLMVAGTLTLATLGARPASAAPVPPAMAAPQVTPVPITLGTSEITSGADRSLCLDNGGGQRTRGNVINIYQCNDTWGGEVWTVEYDGTIRIQNYCLDVHGGSTTKGAQVLLNSCNGAGSPGEAWQPQSNGSLLNLNSGLCLGINGVVQNGTTLFIWPCDGDATQVWNLPSGETKAATAASRMQLMYNSAEGLFDTVGNCTSVTDPHGNCWWWSANELDALIDFMWNQDAAVGSPFPGSPTYEADVANTFEIYGLGPCGGTIGNGCTGRFTQDRYYDDAGWWGLTWLNAYNLFRDGDYLTMAENIFSYIRRNGWDTYCDGGVWQDYKSTASKDAIANELYFELAARLYRTTDEGTYLQAANAEWNWLKRSLIIEVPEDGTPTVATPADLSNPNARILVADHVAGDRATITTRSLCPPAGGTQKWTYNQGVILGALHDMYKITGDASTYVTPAEAIANTALSDVQSAAGQTPGPYSNPALVDVYGTLSEPCDPVDAGSGEGWPAGCDVTGKTTGYNWYLQFKGIFMRNLACLSQDVTGNPAYATFMSHNALEVWDDDQNTTSDFNAAADLNLFGFLWDNDGSSWPGTETAELNEATQGSALDALVANMGSSYAMC